jgi:hypothetical protein
LMPTSQGPTSYTTTSRSFVERGARHADSRSMAGCAAASVWLRAPCHASQTPGLRGSRPPLRTERCQHSGTRPAPQYHADPRICRREPLRAVCGLSGAAPNGQRRLDGGLEVGLGRSKHVKLGCRRPGR